MDPMTHAQFVAETARRMGINEGTRLYKYKDSKGITTLGIGFNMERGDARRAIEQSGGDWPTVLSAPTAVDGSPENAVASCISQSVAERLFEYSFAPIEGEARASLNSGIYDAMTDARRFVICDLVFNMGNVAWLDFVNTRALINQAQAAKNAGANSAHDLFEAAADHLEESAYYSQVGDRAKRNCAMLRAGIWCNATGDGSDI